MQQDENVVINVKQFVNKFENSTQKDGSEKPSKDGQQKRYSTEINKVAAIKESFEKSLQQEYIPKRSITSGGRRLAEVKNDLCKSMELSDIKNTSFPNYGQRKNIKKGPQLTRYNSTDVLSQVKDESFTRFYPVPAPRQCNLVKQNKIDRRYKSNSDLTSPYEPSTCIFNLNSLKQEFRRSAEEEHLEEILEVSVLSSKFGSNKSLEDVSTDLLKEEIAFLDLPTKESDVIKEKCHPIQTNNINSEECETTKKVSFNDKSNDSSLYCCRLKHSDWSRIVLSSLSNEENKFHVNFINWQLLNTIQGNDKMASHLLSCCDFESIVDVLTFEGIDTSTSLPIIPEKYIPNAEREELISTGKKFEVSLTTSLNNVNIELFSSLQIEQEMMTKVFKDGPISKLRMKFDSLLKDTQREINLLFLLNRMWQPYEVDKSKKASNRDKLNDAKAIKTKLDLNCHRLLEKLESSLSEEYFKECLLVLRTKLSLSLKRECISFKLARITKILNLLEDPTKPWNIN